MEPWVLARAYSDGLLRPADGFGDWLNADGETLKDVIATAYFAHAAVLAVRMAGELGRDPALHEDLSGRVREAFRRAYIDAVGRVKGRRPPV
ncbi:hypothetical protein HBK87_07565 [Streptomyces sp. 2BBP-J2]|nr:hypothetical protein [Streptomyces sp. 2BBP-J2]